MPVQEVGTSADGFDSTFYLDASIQYNVNRHLRLTLEGTNLTNQFDSEFDDTSRDVMYC